MRGIWGAIAALLVSLAAGCATSGDKDKKDPVAEHIAELEKAAAAQPGDAQAQYALGNAYFDAARYTEARAAYTKAAEIEPTFADAYTNLGLVYRVEGDLASAIKNYETALAIHPDDNVTRQNLIVALEAAEQLDAAAAQMAELSRRTPSDVALLGQLAALYQTLERFPEAETVFRQYLAKQAGDAAGWFALGECQHAQGKSAAAIESWTQAISINRDLVAAYGLLAEAYTDQGDYDRAWAAVREAQRLGGFVTPELTARLQDASGKLGPE